MELYCTCETWKVSAKKRDTGAERARTTSSMTEDDMSPYFLKANIATTRVDETRSAGGAARAFSIRCARLFREQRARFYIVRRCVVMLICWNDYP